VTSAAQKRARSKYETSPKGKAARAAIRRERPRPPSVQRKYHLKSKFGLTIEQLRQMYENQEGLCDICSTLMILGSEGCSGLTDRHAVIDHDHVTDKIRGLLCRRCNTGIGMLKDSPVLATNAAHYLAA
jgi:hypothetical protein